MLLDRSFRFVFRNFSTLFLVVAAVTVTAHLVYGLLYRKVLEVTEIHPFIEELGPGRYVKEVGAKDLEASRTAALVLAGIQLLLVPLLVGATRRVLAVDARGEVPTALDALRHPRGGPRLSFAPTTGRVGTWIGGALVAAAVWFLTERAGLVLAEPVPDGLNFVVLPVVRGAALALGAPFLLGAVAVAGVRERDRADLRISA